MPNQVEKDAPRFDMNPPYTTIYKNHINFHDIESFFRTKDIEYVGLHNL
jgi:hypothetical protein